jgi:hypothetical protein
MPITTWQMHGNWSPTAPRKYGFSNKDAAILTQHAEKIHRKWSNTKNDFDFYFIRSPQAYKKIEVGEVTPEWVKTELGLDITPNPNSITIIFTNNTGTEKIPMTAWTIAHRLGHAIRRSANWEIFRGSVFKDFGTILRDVYGVQRPWTYNGYFVDQEAANNFRELFYAVGTMKSTRDRNLVSVYEFLYELLAQYILTGKIRFNPLPKQIGTPRYFGKGGFLRSRLDDEELQNHSDWIQSNADNYVYLLDSILNSLDGKIFVM